MRSAVVLGVTAAIVAGTLGLGSVVPAPVGATPPTTERDPATSVPEPPRPTPDYVDHPVNNRQRAASYAYRWATSTNPRFVLALGGKLTVPSDNPLQRGRAVDSYGLWELDCTNYMSQALRAGGFAYTKAWWYNAANRTASVAWVRAVGPDGLPAVFSRLGRMRLVNSRGTVRGQPPPRGIQLGDLIIWDLDGVPGHMHVDHELMVTEVSGNGRSWNQIRVSYHTYDHRNRAMDEYQDYVSYDAPDARLYVFHVNYPK